MRAAWIMLGLFACAGTPALAQVNKWVDEKGRVHYGDKPPASSAAGKGQAQNVPQPKGPQKAKPLPVQPKFHVPGDPLVERMREHEERRQNERLTAECWNSGGSNCNESGTIFEMRQAETKPAPATKPNPREPLPADFCKRNPRVAGCEKP
jgi:Domain of unknown function (DUF4124)